MILGLLLSCLRSGSGQLRTLLQSWHSEGVPEHFPPKLSGKQEPALLPDLGGPTYCTVQEPLSSQL